MSTEITPESKNFQADVVVIGGGGAGLAAAVAAAEKGAKVILLEKRGLGGSSALAFGIFAAESPVQKRAAIDISCDDCFKIAMDWAHWRVNPRIIRAFIDKTGDTVRWLEEKGLEFEIGQLSPDQLPVFHLPKGRGAMLIKTLAQNCKNVGGQILIRTPARKILTGDKGNITGVLAGARGNEFTIRTKSVVIATGGFAGNKKLLKKYCPDYHDNMERIGVPNTGDGLLMALELGAATEGLGNMLMGMPSALHPPDLGAKVDTPPDIFQMGIGSVSGDPRTISVNKKGRRFVEATVRQPGNVSYALFDSQLVQHISEQGPFMSMGVSGGAEGKKLPGLVNDLRRIQAETGLVRIFDSWDEVAAYIGCDPGALKAEIDEYNAACDRGRDPLFARDPRFLMPLRTPPYYVVAGYTSLLNTMGGIKINEYTEVLDKQGTPIPGLYAAGVDTGGWETESYCGRLFGHALGFSVSSGRIAGENAAKFTLGK